MEETDVPMIVRKGRGVNLVYKRYCHKKDKARGDKQHWRCVQTGCRGRVHTTGEGDNLAAVHFVDHNHIPDEEKDCHHKDKVQTV